MPRCTSRSPRGQTAHAAALEVLRAAEELPEYKDPLTLNGMLRAYEGYLGGGQSTPARAEDFLDSYAIALTAGAEGESRSVLAGITEDSRLRSAMETGYRRGAELAKGQSLARHLGSAGAAALEEHGYRYPEEFGAFYQAGQEGLSFPEAKRMAGVSGLGEVRKAVFTAAWEAGRKDGNDYEETSGYDLGFEDGSRYAVSDDSGQRAAGVGARGQAGAVEEGAGGSESREGGRVGGRGAGHEGARTDLKKLGVASGTDAEQRVMRRERHDYGGEVITVSDRLEVYGADGKKTTVQAISTGKDVILREGDPMYGQHRLHELEHVRQRSMTDEEITAAFKEKTKDLPDGKVRSILRAYALDYYGLYGEDSTTMGDLYREYLADRAAGIPQKETDKAVRLPDERNAAKDQRRDIYAMRGNQTQEHLTRDKYYDRQIDKWDGKDHGGSFRVGSVSAPLLKVGIPDTDIWFDQSKAAKQLMEKKEITKDILKKIPDVLAHPIAVSESYDNTVMVFGQLFDEQNNPIVVALRINSTNRRNHITLVNKIRSVGTRTHNLDKLLSEDSLLYLGENKKETNTWFNALGRSTPFGGTRYGLIRSISQSGGKVNGTRKENYSLSAPERDKTYLSAVESGDMETAQKMVEEAAKAAGYVTHAYHGTLTKGITEFKKSFIGSRFSYDEVGFFFTDNLKLAQDYATSEFDADRKGEVISAYIRTKNAFTFDATYALKNGYGKVFRDNDAVDVWDNYQSALLEEAEEHHADSIIIKDGNSMMVVAFEPNQIKSAEPVVYDNSGNVIPLSERFNPRKRDIRYSVSEEAEPTSSAEYAQMQRGRAPAGPSEREAAEQRKRQVTLLSHMTERAFELRRQFTEGTQRDLRTTDIPDVASELLRFAGRKAMGRGELEQRLSDIAMKAARSQNPMEAYQVAKEEADYLAADMMRNATGQTDEAKDMWDGIRQTLRSGGRPVKLAITGQSRADLEREGGYEHLRKRLMGYAFLSPSGTPVEVFYEQELTPRFPTAFPETIQNPADQLIRIVDVLDRFRQIFKSPWAGDAAEDTELLSQERCLSFKKEWTGCEVPKSCIKMEMRAKYPSYFYNTLL